MFDIVIVLYQLKAADSLTIQTLQQILTFNNLPELRQIFVFDNSTMEDTPVFTDERFTYRFAEGNQGLAKAYNYVWPKSLMAGCRWLITLDQDTQLTNEYFIAVINEIKKANEHVAVIAPIIYDKTQQISPVRNDTLRPLHTSLPMGGETYHNQVMVINSAAVVSLRFLQQIVGYNEVFSLDYLDHWLCWKVYQEKEQIKILQEALHHQLSVLDYKGSMNVARYEQILAAEGLFYRYFETKMFRAYRKQLLFRSIKQILKGLFVYAKQTIKHYITISEENHENQSTNTK